MSTEQAWSWFLEIRTQRIFNNWIKQNQKLGSDSVLQQSMTVSRVQRPTVAFRVQEFRYAVYVHVQIYNVEQRHINVVYFNVDINNVRQRQNNVVILNAEFHNVDQRRSNVLSTFKKLKSAKKYFYTSKKRWLIWLTTLTFDCDWLKRKGNMERTM